MTKNLGKTIRNILAISTLTAASAASNSAVIVLDFEGVGDNANINDFYNGGTDSLGNSGTNYQIGFGTNTLGIVDQDAGGGGNFANEPSPDTIMFFLTGTAILNYAPGFQNGFSFFYTSSTVASVFVYDGLNATGNILTTLNLSSQHDDNCSGDPTGSFCNWTGVGGAFAGIAKSIDFGGTVNQIGYDDITFGSSTPGGPTPVNAPTSLLLALLGGGYLFSRRGKS